MSWSRLEWLDFRLCDEKFAGRNGEIFSQSETGAHGVSNSLDVQPSFDSSAIRSRDLCAQPLRPSYLKRPVHRRLGVITFGSLAIGDGTATDTIGFLAITSGLLWGPTDGFTATGFTVAMAGSGSKAIGVIEKRRNQSLPGPGFSAH
jgi:hypothetical protein